MTRYGRHHTGVGRHRARPAWQFTLLAVVGGLAFLAGYLAGRHPEQEHPMNKCDVCGGINSQHCWKCRRGGFQPVTARPWLCPICYHRPCSCEADGQRVTRRLVVVR